MKLGVSAALIWDRISGVFLESYWSSAHIGSLKGFNAHGQAEEIGSNISDGISRGSKRVAVRGGLVKRRENLSVSHVLSPSCYQQGAHIFGESLPTSVKAIKTTPHKLAHNPAKCTLSLFSTVSFSR